MRNLSKFLEEMAATNKRFALWILVSVLLAAGAAKLSKVSALAQWPMAEVATFFSGLVFALTLHSWTSNPQERKRQSAIDMYWGDFRSNATVVMPTSEEIPDPSPFTPFQDAVAVSEVQDFLHTKFGSKPDLLAADEHADLEKLYSHNLLIIGGPKFNRIADQFMTRFLSERLDHFFHWTWHLQREPWAKEVAQEQMKARGHVMLQLERRGDSVVVRDEIHDVFGGSDSEAPLEAKGFVLWAPGFLHPNRTVVMFAGVRSAFGTLAAARFFMNAENLLSLPDGILLQVFVSTLVEGYEIGKVKEVRHLESAS